MPIVSLMDCITSFGSYIQPGMICAGYYLEGGVDACQVYNFIISTQRKRMHRQANTMKKEKKYKTKNNLINETFESNLCLPSIDIDSSIRVQKVLAWFNFHYIAESRHCIKDQKKLMPS